MYYNYHINYSGNISVYIILLVKQEPYYCGVTRIRNPKTLQKWINKGWYQDTLNEGYIFAIGCGRFRQEPCTCCKCRKSTNSPLKHIIEKHYKPIQ